jgi:lipid A 4'-phosphatase
MIPVGTTAVRSDRSNKVSRTLLLASLAACTVAAVVFLTFPQIDLWASASLYRSQPNTQQPPPWLSALRYSMVAIFWAGSVVVITGVLGAWMRNSHWLGLTAARWLFIGICLIVGPGLVANTLLKENWGRARPKQIAEFGGDKAYSPPLLPSNQCKSNCSFVSGEAAAMFAPFYAAALVIPQGSALLLAAGTLAGLAAGLVRMSQGAHFLSDVVFAGIFMALTVTLLHRLMFAWPLPALLEAACKRRRSGSEAGSSSGASAA